jgi:hypothetical protein
MLLDLA